MRSNSFHEKFDNDITLDSNINNIYQQQLFLKSSQPLISTNTYNTRSKSVNKFYNLNK